MKLERVSEDFHVIALGLPVPAFKGHSLDPPLRSRFQSRQISELPFSSMSSLCEFLASNVGVDRLNTLLALAYGINSQKAENSAISLPLVPIDNLLKAVQVWVCVLELSKNETFFYRI
jgi:von Willebrand factor A domain-containing protein 8